MKKILLSSFFMASVVFGFDVKTWAKDDSCANKQSENVCKMTSFIYKYNVFYDRTINEMLKMNDEREISEAEKQKRLDTFYDYFKLTLTNLHHACRLWTKLDDDEREFLYLLEYHSKNQTVPAIQTSDFNSNNLWCKKKMNINSELFLGDFFEKEYVALRYGRGNTPAQGNK